MFIQKKGKFSKYNKLQKIPKRNGQLTRGGTNIDNNKKIYKRYNFLFNNR